MACLNRFHLLMSYWAWFCSGIIYFTTIFPKPSMQYNVLSIVTNLHIFLVLINYCIIVII